VLRRDAAGALLDFIIMCKRNQTLLTEPDYQEFMATLYQSILKDCGDYATQVGHMQMLLNTLVVLDKQHVC
jgi:hypothetical protein